MTPEAFRRWIDEMKDAGLAGTDAKCAELLGRHPNALLRMKRDGADQVTALACRALLHRMTPYS